MLAEKTVTVIPARPELRVVNGRPIKKNVAAYCRVSTDEEEQEQSQKNQIEYFTDKINSNPEWVMVGVFADDGITGTSAKKRPEFMKLMSLCKKGKVDLILTKSISRFSRNNADFIKYLRELKDKDIGIFFEREQINTLTTSSEVIITLLGALAQGESESISGNVKTGIRMGFKNGKVPFQYKKMLGYRKGADGNPEIVPPEAEIVQKIYADYLSGYSIERISQELEQNEYLTALGKNEWSPQTIRNILYNEKYCGNALLQKTFIKDCISKKVIKNTGQIPQYLIRNNHPAIVPEEMFNRVAEERARRANKRKVSEKNAITEHGKYSSKFALTELLYCGDCGTAYRKVTWAKRGKKKVVWRCVNRIENGTKYCNNSPTIEEQALQTAIVKALNELDKEKDTLTAIIKDTILYAYDAQSGTVDTAGMQDRIRELNAEMIKKMNDGISAGISMDELDSEFMKISDEIKTLQGYIDTHERATACAGNADIAELTDALQNTDLTLKEYDDQTLRQLIGSIKVLTKDKALIFFKCGMETEVTLNEQA